MRGLKGAFVAASISQSPLARSQAKGELEDNYLIALAKQGRADAYDRIVRRY